MSKSTRQIRAERRERKRRRQQVTYGIVALIIVVLGAIILLAGRVGDSERTPEQALENQAELSQGLGHEKSRGVANAPVVVMDYGDFQ